ncbi:hypothetical protein HOLleu_13609 [Holothuria leucospilota]|uniref:Endonuclease/exonuclease/phosphatase domain-containing protein n=1 Tax=Holothuria leucospilota TaxID=206669 RepID=A0A9Q1CD94_HOLLE|nr:hypothetical protein HOLleu_13609 [Holothuria leucospilota]
MDEKYWCNEWGSNILFAHGSNDSRGVCILFNPKLHFTVLKHTSHVDGRFILVDIQFHDHIITIVGVYGPNIDSPSFFVNLSRELSSFQGDTIIMAGDFNFVFNLKLDKVGGQFKTNFKARDECLSLMTVHNLIDIWREKNPFSKHFTWSSNITPGIHCRLDFFLVSRSVEHSTTDISFSPGIQSDHFFLFR